MESNSFEHLNKPPGPETYPLAYLITFTCYGTFLHGAERSSVDRHHNRFGTPLLPPDTSRLEAVRSRLKQEPYRLDEQRRQVVLEGLKEACHDRTWLLFGAHVRSNHVHVVVQAEAKPKIVLCSLKARASRKLTQLGIDRMGRRRWTRGGSTIYLWQQEDVEFAIEYVVERQGQKMAVYECSVSGDFGPVG